MTLDDKIALAIKDLENAVKALRISVQCLDRAALKLRHTKPKLVVDNDPEKNTLP